MNIHIQSPRKPPPNVPDHSFAVKVGSWHVPPPPDPVFSRRLCKLRWERELVIFVEFALLACAFPLHDRFPFIQPVFAFYASFAICLGVWNRRALPQVGHLMDIPAAPDQFPVFVRYRLGLHVYGKDHGVLTLSDDWLTFQGLESEFSVRPTDVFAEYPNAKAKDRRRQLYGEEPLTLAFTIEQVPLAVEIFPFDRINGVTGRFRLPFRL